MLKNVYIVGVIAITLSVYGCSPSPNEAANALYVQASNLAENVNDEDPQAALARSKQVLELLNRIVEEQPQSDLAVQLVSGSTGSGLSLSQAKETIEKYYKQTLITIYPAGGRSGFYSAGTFNGMVVLAGERNGACLLVGYGDAGAIEWGPVEIASCTNPYVSNVTAGSTFSVVSQGLEEKTVFSVSEDGSNIEKAYSVEGSVGWATPLQDGGLIGATEESDGFRIRRFDHTGQQLWEVNYRGQKLTTLSTDDASVWFAFESSNTLAAAETSITQLKLDGKPGKSFLANGVTALSSYAANGRAVFVLSDPQKAELRTYGESGYISSADIEGSEPIWGIAPGPDGQTVLWGFSRDEQSTGWVMKLGADGRVIDTENYRPDPSTQIYTGAAVKDGTFILGGMVQNERALTIILPDEVAAN